MEPLVHDRVRSCVDSSAEESWTRSLDASVSSCTDVDHST